MGTEPVKKPVPAPKKKNSPAHFPLGKDIPISDNLRGTAFHRNLIQRHQELYDLHHKPQSKATPHSPKIATKLKVGAPDDQYEQEADAVAERVVSAPRGIQRKQTETMTPPRNWEGNPGIQLKQTETMTPPRNWEGNPGIQLKQTETMTPPRNWERNPGIQLKQTETMTPPRNWEGNPGIQLKQTETMTPPGGPEIKRKCASCGAAVPDLQEKCANCGGEARPEKMNQSEGGTINTKLKFPEVPEAEKPDKSAEISSEERETELPTGAESTPETKAKDDGPADLPPAQPLEVKEPEVPALQTKGGDQDTVSPELESNIQTSKGSGQPLPENTQSEMGAAMGKDFSGVRIHSGAQATAMNEELGSKAFAHGSDVYFNEGQYNTGSTEGKRLLAHELTHTVQQGAVGDQVQMYKPDKENDAKVEDTSGEQSDGQEVEGRMDNRLNDPDNEKAEEGEEVEIDRGEVGQENRELKATGDHLPSQDRGAEAQQNTQESAEQIQETVGAEAEGPGEAEKAKEGQAPQGNMADAAAADALALQLHQKSLDQTVPEEPQPFKIPEIKDPVDSKGEPVPREIYPEEEPKERDIDIKVQGLAMAGDKLRQSGYAMKKNAQRFAQIGDQLAANHATQRADLARAKEGAEKTEDHTAGRREIQADAEVAKKDVQERQEFVAREAPKLSSKASKGKEKSGSLVSQTEEKSGKMDSQKPSDPDAQADAEKQAGDMNQASDGAASMDDAMQQAESRADQYTEEAVQAKIRNTESETAIAETDATLTQLEGEVERMKGVNAEAEAQLQATAGHADQVHAMSVRQSRSGDELIAATHVMEDELNDAQETYISRHKSLPGREDAEKAREEEAASMELPAEEMLLYQLAAMAPAEREAFIETLSEEQREQILAKLNELIAEAEGQDEAAAKGDPRIPDIAEINNERRERAAGVQQLADVNWSFLSREQKMQLAEELTAKSLRDDLAKIVNLQFVGQMLQSMIDPRVALKGAWDGLKKFGTGLASIFDGDAWSKDPLGNLLSIAANITTGLAMVFSSIIGISTLVMALLTVVIIVSWFTTAPINVPGIGWMGTLLTFAGKGAMITGALSMYFNYLSYLKNVHDAGASESSEQLLGETKDMRANATDGLQGALAVVEGFGAAKMGPHLKANGLMTPGAARIYSAAQRATSQQLKRRLFRAAARQQLLDMALALPRAVGAGAKWIWRKGAKSLKEFRSLLQGLFRRKKGADVDLPEGAGRTGVEVPERIPGTEGAGDLVGTSKSGSIGGHPHSISVRNWNGQKRLILCSPNCGPVITRCDEIIDQLPDGPVKTEMQQIRKDAVDLEAEIKAGTVTDAAAQTRFDDLLKRLDGAATKSPVVNRVVDDLKGDLEWEGGLETDVRAQLKGKVNPDPVREAKLIDKMIKTMQASGEAGARLGQRIKSGKFAGIDGYMDLIKKGSVDSQSIRAINQAMDKAEELMGAGHNPNSLRFEDNPGKYYDVDLGIKKPGKANQYTEAYQFKSNTENLNSSIVQDASSQLMKPDTQKAIVEFALAKGDSIARIKADASLLREFDFWLHRKGLKSRNNKTIQEFHIIEPNGNKFIVTHDGVNVLINPA